MTKNEFKCTKCGGIFEKEWTDEKAKEEAKEKFGYKIFEQTSMVLVCDDCYKEFL